MLRYGFVGLVALVSAAVGMQIKPENLQRSEENCKRLTWDPYFEPDMVVGMPWKIYYSWNLDWGARCLDMVFKKATPKIVERIHDDMYEYLEQHPTWDAATLLLSTGNANHELLLIADQGPAGAFIGVPNVVRDANMSPARQSVPLLKFHMKLIYNKQYLIILDCHVGVGTLAARGNTEPPSQEEISSLTKEYNLGNGSHVCVKRKERIDRYLE